MFEQKINNLIRERMPRTIGGQSGYTLIEIVMVIVILGVIGAFTFQFVAHGVQAFKKSSARKDLYDQGRLALERMVRELRDAKEVTEGSASSVTFKKAHPAQAADNTEEIKFELVGTDLRRVGDPNGTPATAVLASNVSSFTVTGVAPAGGGGLCASFDAATPATSCDYCAGVTFQHTVGNGTNRLLVVAVGVEHDPGEHTVSGVTYGGQALTKIRGEIAQPGGTEAHAELWYLLDPPSGAANVVVSTGGGTSNVRNLHAGAISLEGVAQQAPEANAGNNLIGAGPISTNITTVSNGAWLIDAVTCGNTGSYTPDSGQTERHDISYNSSSHAGGTREIAVAGATAEQWTHSGANRLAHAVAAFAPATCGGGGGTTLFSDDFEDGVMTVWSKVSGLDMQETGGVFTTTGNDASHYKVESGSSWTDYSFDVDAIANDDDALGITFRVEDSNSFYLLEQTFGDSTWDLRLRVNDNGSWSTLGTVANNGANPGQVNSETTSYNYKVEVSGTNIKAYIDDVLKFDVNDATVSGGTVGLWINWANGTTFDDVLVEGYGGSLATLEITLEDPNDSSNTVSMRTKAYLRNLP
jgi:prepilin-type N-terminal cleavage/methylation domain-containing protein